MDNEKIEKIINSLSDEEKNALYRKLWLPYVIEDIECFAETQHIVLTAEQIKNIAKRYVYEGEYDEELNYWDNIDNLIQSYTK